MFGMGSAMLAYHNILMNLWKLDRLWEYELESHQSFTEIMPRQVGREESRSVDWICMLTRIDDTK